MQKTGWIELDKTKAGEKAAVCQSCRMPARRRVTFEDSYGKLEISLCDECADKDYLELISQGRFAWPVKSDVDIQDRKR